MEKTFKTIAAESIIVQQQFQNAIFGKEDVIISVKIYKRVDKKMKKRNFGFISLSAIVIVIASGVLFGQKSVDLNDFRQNGARFGSWSAPVNLGPSINSTADESAAVLSKDGLTLYFTSNRLGSFGGEDIWVAHRANLNDTWGTPENLGPIVNSGSLDRLRSISPDGRVLLFQSSRDGGLGGNDIWASTRRRTNNDFEWSRPVNLGTIINTTANEVAANYLFGSFGLNHKLFFSSARSGGVGGADIYISDIPRGGTFGQPVNIVELNSPYNDTCFWVRDDGLEIIFSSTRAGLNNDPTSFDLWVSTRSSIFDRWSPPVSLGPTLNTEGRLDVNPNLSADGTTMIFTSERDGGFGGSDIYITTRTVRRQDE